MKKLFCLLFLFTSLSAYSQTLKSSGIIVGAGRGVTSYSLPQSVADVPVSIDKANSYFKSKLALELGYRFRLQPTKSRFFYNIDLLAGYNRHEYGANFMLGKNPTYAGPSGTRDVFSASVAGAVNYTIVKGLSVGIGVQPTYSFSGAKAFDIPLFATVAYDLKYVELAFSYKQGLLTNDKVNPFENLRLSQWQFSVYVPLFRNR